MFVALLRLFGRLVQFGYLPDRRSVLRYYIRLEAEVLSLVQSDLMQATAAKASTSQAVVPSPVAGTANATASLSTGAPSTQPVQTAKPQVTQAEAGYVDDVEAEAEYFGMPEAIAICPRLKWAQVALALFDLLDTLTQHNVNALVNDALRFYANNASIVDYELALPSAASLLKPSGALPFAQLTPPSPDDLVLNVVEADNADDGDEATFAPPSSTVSAASSPYPAQTTSRGRKEPVVVDPWYNKLRRFLANRLASTSSTSLSKSSQILIGLCTHPYPAVVSAAYRQLFNLFQEKLKFGEAMGALVLIHESGDGGDSGGGAFEETATPTPVLPTASPVAAVDSGHVEVTIDNQYAIGDDLQGTFVLASLMRACVDVGASIVDACGCGCTVE